jgi:hypothetical protein
MPTIDRAEFAEGCVRQGLSCGANPHYLLGVAQLRSKIADDTVGDQVGPFRLTQTEWNLHCTDSAFNLDFLPADITDPDSQVAVFAVMARRAFDAFEAASHRTPNTKELYLQQFPGADSATLATDLKTALDATAALVDPAAAAVLDDDQVPPPKITNPEQPVSGGADHPAGPSGSGGGDGGPIPREGPTGSRGSGVFNPRFNAFFTSLVPGGFFSSNPDSNDKRSIRTNNPGALNISSWQRSRPGFVGVTADDGKGNVTSIYCAPEYGVASWYHLLAVIYDFARTGSFTIQQLARKYAGKDAAQSTVDNYVNVWCRVADSPLTGDSVIQLGNDDGMLNLARAMYRNEAGKPTPLSDAQILFGMRHERDNSLPAPPAPPAAQVVAGNTGGSSGT